MMGFWEDYRSRDRTQAEDTKSRLTRRFWVDGTADDQVAMDTFTANIDTLFRGLELQDIDIERAGLDLWEATANYVDPDDDDGQDKQPELGEVVWSFDTGGGIAHITQAKKGNTFSYAAAGVTKRDFKGGIGVQNDTVEGVDIVVPALKLQAQVRLVNSTITSDWLKSVYSLTGKVNNASWFGFDAGEILFMGATGQEKVGSGNPTLTFSFEGSENLDDLTYVDYNGNDINVAFKGGHDYVWISYTPAEDTAAKTVAMRPHTAFVEKVYDDGDFTILGLGS